MCGPPKSCSTTVKYEWGTPPSPRKFLGFAVVALICATTYVVAGAAERVSAHNAEMEEFYVYE